MHQHIAPLAAPKHRASMRRPTGDLRPLNTHRFPNDRSGGVLAVATRPHAAPAVEPEPGPGRDRSPLCGGAAARPPRFRFRLLSARWGVPPDGTPGRARGRTPADSSEHAARHPHGAATSAHGPAPGLALPPRAQHPAHVRRLKDSSVNPGRPQEPLSAPVPLPSRRAAGRDTSSSDRTIPSARFLIPACREAGNGNPVRAECPNAIQIRA